MIITGSDEDNILVEEMVTTSLKEIKGTTYLNLWVKEMTSFQILVVLKP